MHLDRNNVTLPPEIAELIKKQKRIKKIIIISAIVTVLLFAVLIAVLSLPAGKDGNGSSNKPGSSSAPSYIFYPLNYGEDIYQNSEYMSRNRNIMFKNIETGVTEDIYLSSNDEYLMFMAQLVTYIIEGDAKSYNACFSEEYLSENSESLKERFTMQMLYDIVVTRHYLSDGVVYSLEYKIMKNNGSYRSDMPSDCSKAQYFVISDHGGKLLIDSLTVVGGN